jgi:hypothetical protein
MAHTHHCEVCKQPVAICGDDYCQGDSGHYCTAHHPDPQFHHEDEPTVRMTVRVAKEDE